MTHAHALGAAPSLFDAEQLLGAEQRSSRKVVLMRAVDGSESLGLPSREDCADLPGFPADHVAVYLPMSSQIGGLMLILPRQRVREFSTPVEQALRPCVRDGQVEPDTRTLFTHWQAIVDRWGLRRTQPVRSTEAFRLSLFGVLVDQLRGGAWPS